MSALWWMGLGIWVGGAFGYLLGALLGGDDR